MGGLLGGKDPTGRFLHGSEVSVSHHRSRWRFGTCLVRAGSDAPDRIAVRNHRRDDFAAGAGHQSGEDADVDGRPSGNAPSRPRTRRWPRRGGSCRLPGRSCNSRHKARRRRSRPAWRLGPTTGFARPTGRRTARRSGPAVRPCHSCGRPAHSAIRIVLRGAVRDVGQAPGGVDREDALVIAPARHAGRRGDQSGRCVPGRHRQTHARIVPAGGSAVERFSRRRGNRGERPVHESGSPAPTGTARLSTACSRPAGSAGRTRRRPSGTGWQAPAVPGTAAGKSRARGASVRAYCGKAGPSGPTAPGGNVLWSSW